MIKKTLAALFTLLVTLTSISSLKAEPYVSASLGWTFNQKLKNIKGDENLDYANPIGTTDGNYYPGTSYTNIKLKDVLSGGVKAGYYFESAPNIGLEIEANYSQPNMKRQNVTISNSSGTGASSGTGIGDWISYGPGGGSGPFGSNGLNDVGEGPSSSPNSVTENQLPAKIKLLQFNLNALYRYQGFKEFTPYIGGGPSINIIRITGTGESGHFVDPVDPGNYLVTLASDAPNVHNTSVNVGANFKVGAEYKFDQDWGVGAEYHYNWVPVDISHFRSANNLSADLEMQSFNIVLTKHF